jgi:hypothetical protein
MGRLVALSSITSLSIKNLPGKNTLAYFATPLVYHYTPKDWTRVVLAGSTMEEKTSHNPKIEGSKPATVSGRYKME